MYFKIGAFKNFANFTDKILVLETLFKKVSDIQACNVTKKRLQHRWFPVKFVVF